MADEQGLTDKSPGWESKHPNPSGLPDGDPSKVVQPVAEMHHEEGHTEPAPAEPDQAAQS